MSKCVCEGNWRLIISKVEHLIGRTFSSGGIKYCFLGVLWSDDDFYYVMSNHEHGIRLLTCVGSIEDQGFEFSGYYN